MNRIIRPRSAAILVSSVLYAAGCTIINLGGGGANGGSKPSGPGHSFADAGPVQYDASGTARLTGEITTDDADLYDLGPMKAGDRVIVRVKAVAPGNLDPTTAVFDANQDLFTLNDDINLDANELDSMIDEVIREDGAKYYLGVARSSFSRQTSGPYEATVTVLRGGAPVPPAGQVVYLNFNGGTALIAHVDTYILPPFNAADIDSAYAGQTELIKQTIVSTVKSNFAGLNITILSSDDGPHPAGLFSEVFFGAYDGQAFGISEAVDHWNKSHTDRSIIYTNRFDNPFSPRPSATGIGVAIGNVAAHEIGHLLGLEHTADVTDLMDTTGRAGTLLGDQSFKAAPLDSSIFPVGTQDGWQLLSQELGTL